MTHAEIQMYLFTENHYCVLADLEEEGSVIPALETAIQ